MLETLKLVKTLNEQRALVREPHRYSSIMKKVCRTELNEQLIQHTYFLTGTEYSRALSYSDVDLRGNDFSYRDLRGASFRGCDLRGTSFEGCNLSGADFTGANCEGAILSEADMNNTNLQGANFLRALLTDTTLHDAFMWDIVGNAKEIRNITNSGKYNLGIAYTAHSLQVDCGYATFKEWGELNEENRHDFTISNEGLSCEKVSFLESEYDWWMEHKHLIGEIVRNNPAKEGWSKIHRY